MRLDGFYDAATAREITIGSGAGSGGAVLKEINDIETIIDAQVVAGNLRVDVTTTDMAQNTGLDYYTAWAENSATDPESAVYDANAAKAREQMSRVIAYFTRLGYIIRRERVGVTNFFQWTIRW